MSGWADIQEVLRVHGSVDNARLYGNLTYLLEQYKSKLKIILYLKGLIKIKLV